LQSLLCQNVAADPWSAIKMKSEKLKVKNDKLKIKNEKNSSQFVVHRIKNGKCHSCETCPRESGEQESRNQKSENPPLYSPLFKRGEIGGIIKMKNEAKLGDREIMRLGD